MPSKQPLTAPESYDPNHLLDALIRKLRLKNDAELCAALQTAPPVLSKIRHGRLAIGAPLLIRMQDATNLDLKQLRFLMGDRRERFRMIPRQSTARVTELEHDE